MKKLLSILTALVLILSTLALASCDELVIEDLSAEQTTASPEEIKEMTAKALYESFVKTANEVKTYEAKQTLVDTDYNGKGETATASVNIKKNESALYMSSQFTDSEGTEGVEYTYIDGILYMSDGETKTKMASQMAESFVSELNIDDLFVQFKELPQEIFDNVEVTNPSVDAKALTYSFTVTLSAELCRELSIGEEPCEVTFTFDKDGIFKSISQKMGSMTTTAEFVSVNKPVEIAAPADAEAYKDFLAGI